MDPLDRVDFDPVQFINQSFPTEESLTDLDTFVVGVNSQISTLNEEISRAVQAQSTAGQQATKEIAEAQQSINELYGKIQDIKAKASQSERMVQEICADIKKLDYAKSHLQSTITALKRLQMLTTAVSQLEVLARDYQYREAANLLDAVKQLMAHFEQYTAIPMIADIKSRVDAIQNDLKRHVHKAFREIGEVIDSVADIDVVLQSLPGNMKSLSDACLVVDALGPAARKNLLEEIVQLQLLPYEKLFGVDKQHYSLDQVDRRWAWFKRLMKSVDTKFANLCPAHWRFPLRLCLEFVERTHSHLFTLLTNLESKDQIDVNALLRALQTALRFEQEMLIRFTDPKLNNPEPDLLSTSAQRRNSNIAASPAEAAMQQRLKKEGSLMYVPTDHNAILNEDESEQEFVNHAVSVIGSCISGTFDKFMGSYVTLERHNLEEMLHRLAQEEDTAQQGGGAESPSDRSQVFGSSISMFVFIKNSIKRCTALTTGQTFLFLVKEFKTSLHHYADMLRGRCPPLLQVAGGYAGQSQARLSVGQETTICYLINTGEYCSEVVPQLEQMIKTKMQQQYIDKVDLSSEADAFMDIVAYAMRVLVGGIMERLDGPFRAMIQTNWASNDIQVGEESAYVLQFHNILLDAIPRIRESLATSYFNTVCTKLATEILQRYDDAISRQKRITEAATQQLLLDTYNTKTLLMHLHNLGLDAAPNARSNAPAMYSKLVQTKVTHIEAVLKLVGTPEEMLLERFRIMMESGSVDDLVKIMTLKGMKRNDQQTLVEALGPTAKPAAGTARAMSVPPPIVQPSIITTASVINSSVGSTASMATSASIAVASSMRSLTQDLSSSARNAVGNLKWK